MAVQPRIKSIRCLSPCGTHTMAYQEWGRDDDPNALICVHGLTRASDDFCMLARALCGQCRIICPDIVGRGRSSWLSDARYYGMAVYVNDMLALIAHEKVSKFAWLGTSMGGMIGMTIAAMRPNLIRKLILNDVGPVLYPAAVARIGSYVGERQEFKTFREAVAYIRQISASFGHHHDLQWEALARNVLRQNAHGKWIRNHDPAIARAFKEQTEAARQQSERALWAAYDSIACPTLLIRGKDSDLLTSATALEMTRRGPKARLVELDGVGHAPMFMHTHQIELVADFLNS